MNYYGKLANIIELDYYGTFRVVLFKGDWVDVHHSCSIKHNEFGYAWVNFSRLIHTGDKLEDGHFIVSSQVVQVVYVQDPHHLNWSVVLITNQET